MKLSELFLGVLRWLVFTVLLLTLLFGLTGRTDLPMFWAYAAVQSLLALAVILTIDPGLARERRHPGPGGVDRWRAPVIGSLFLSHIAIAALDVGHFHWSDSIPRPTRIAARSTPWLCHWSRGRSQSTVSSPRSCGSRRSAGIAW